MTERPIIMSSPMVRAILAGNKTQTRRVVKHRIDGPHPPTGIYDWHDPRTDAWVGAHGGLLRFSATNAARLSPFGREGDWLWVRETWAPHFIYAGVKPSDILIDARSCLFYRADDGIVGGCVPSQRAKAWRPAIHMPRAASRITLEITAVRVERLQDISEADAMAEGSRDWAAEQDTPVRDIPCGETRLIYRQLWESLHGAGSWDANPWVWKIAFERIKP